PTRFSTEPFAGTRPGERLGGEPGRLGEGLVFQTAPLHRSRRSRAAARRMATRGQRAHTLACDRGDSGGANERGGATVACAEGLSGKPRPQAAHLCWTDSDGAYEGASYSMSPEAISLSGTLYLYRD